MKTMGEIIYALKKCKVVKECKSCPYIEMDNCRDALNEDAIYLIIAFRNKAEQCYEEQQNDAPWTRQRVLKEAERCVCGQREQDYGGPEDSFRLIAELWEPYIRKRIVSDGTDVCIEPHDVAVMMGLLKVARIASNPQHMDNWVDLAGYAACGGEIAGRES